jgi:predicted Zn-dependent peptidase
MFTSRVNLNLREAHAWTYGASSRFAMRHGPGPFRVGAAVKAEHTIESIKEVMKEIDRMRGEAVTDDELKDAKEHTKLGLPARFETVDDMARAMGEILVFGLPLDDYATRIGRTDAVTKDDVLRVMKTYIHPDELRVVVVGDRGKLEADLKALGYGAVEIRDAYGDPMK